MFVLTILDIKLKTMAVCRAVLYPLRAEPIYRQQLLRR